MKGSGPCNKLTATKVHPLWSHSTSESCTSWQAAAAAPLSYDKPLSWQHWNFTRTWAGKATARLARQQQAGAKARRPGCGVLVTSIVTSARAGVNTAGIAVLVGCAASLSALTAVAASAGQQGEKTGQPVAALGPQCTLGCASSPAARLRGCKHHEHARAVAGVTLQADRIDQVNELALVPITDGAVGAGEGVQGLRLARQRGKGWCGVGVVASGWVGRAEGGR
jgi:hypothetical protein